MRNKTLVLAFAAAAMIAFGAPATASEASKQITFTTPDASISVELPNTSWNTIENTNNWITLSDGSSVLTIDHFAIGDVLPEPITIDADGPYAECFQTVFSTKSDIYLFTGTVEQEEKLKDITDIILSASVLNLKAAQGAAPAASQQANPDDGMVPEEYYALDGYDPTAEDGMVPEENYELDGYDPTAEDGMVPEENYALDGIDPTA